MTAEVDHVVAAIFGRKLRTAADVAARLAIPAAAHKIDASINNSASGLYRLNEDQFAERGARMARRDDREYREYLREEQRSQPGCPARELVLDQRGQATSAPSD